MHDAGFELDPTKKQPGAWVSADGVPVDLMVPAAIAGGGANRRSAIHPPHDKRALRRAVGLEAAVVDNQRMPVPSLDPRDQRSLVARVAGPAALLVAKLIKISERIGTDRLQDKDAHDAYRLLVTIETDVLATSLVRLLDDDLAGQVTEQALIHLQRLFAAGPDADGAQMAARTEQGLGQPETVAQASALLAGDLLAAVTTTRPD